MAPGHDRDRGLTDPVAAALLAEPGLDTAHGIEAEGRTAGEDQGVDMLDRAARVEQRGIAQAGCAAADRNRRRSQGASKMTTLVVPDANPRILGLSDAQARDIGDGCCGSSPTKASSRR